MTMVRLTRRQWLELPLERKTRVGVKPAVIAISPDGTQQAVLVQWCARVEDSHMKEAIDTAANGQ